VYAPLLGFGLEAHYRQGPCRLINAATLPCEIKRYITRLAWR